MQRAQQASIPFRCYSFIPVLLALSLLDAGLARAATVSKSFDVAPGGQLVVDSEIGSIEVRSGGGDQVEVDITSSGDAAKRFDVSFSHDGNRVEVHGKYNGNRWLGWLGHPKVELVFRVPDQFDVVLETSGGSISVDDLEGNVIGRTSGGSLHFGNIRGPVLGKTSGGSIQLGASTGTADLRTSGGSIHIGDVDGTVRAETSGGSIRVQEVMGAIQASTSGGGIEIFLSRQPEADCRLTTSGGGITAYLSPELDLDLEAHASGGGVQSDLPFDTEQQSKTVLIGQLNAGGPKIFLDASGGRVRLLRR